VFQCVAACVSALLCVAARKGVAVSCRAVRYSVAHSGCLHCSHPHKHTRETDLFQSTWACPCEKSISIPSTISIVFGSTHRNLFQDSITFLRSVAKARERGEHCVTENEQTHRVHIQIHMDLISLTTKDMLRMAGKCGGGGERNHRKRGENLVGR